MCQAAEKVSLGTGIAVYLSVVVLAGVKRRQAQASRFWQRWSYRGGLCEKRQNAARQSEEGGKKCEEEPCDH